MSADAPLPVLVFPVCIQQIGHLIVNLRTWFE